MSKESYSDDRIFKMLAVSCASPLLLFDAYSVAAANPNGDYYADEGGVDQSLLQRLGFATTSFFSAGRPEETMIIFSDGYGPIAYDEKLAAQLALQPGCNASQLEVKRHPMTHWYSVIAR